jgi:hypothetical protein
MNRTMPPGDCGHRRRVARREPRGARPVSCTVGLVHGIEAHSERMRSLSLVLHGKP